MTIEEIKEKFDKIITSPYGVKNVLNQLSEKSTVTEKVQYLNEILNGITVDNITKPGGANG